MERGCWNPRSLDCRESAEPKLQNKGMTQPILSDWVERLLGERRDQRPVVLLFDYDGTLTPLVSHPKNASLPPATRPDWRH
jgi:hypothetical protein